MKINSCNVNPSKIFLRSSDKGVSYNGFRRKKVGSWNKAENWMGIPTCMECGGFFGIDKEFHGFGIAIHRLTIEMCEWRGKRVPIDNDKICVSEYRVIVTEGNIPYFAFKQCGYELLKNGDYVSEISDGKWVIFGGEIEEITGGVQYFRGEFLAGNVIISDGVQRFWGKSSAGNARIAGGEQHFYDKSSAGNAKITGGNQYLYNESLAGKAEIAGGNQYFCNKSSADNAKISGGLQCFNERSSVGKAKITGGHQHYHNISSTKNPRTKQ